MVPAFIPPCPIAPWSIVAAPPGAFGEGLRDAVHAALHRPDPFALDVRDQHERGRREEG